MSGRDISKLVKLAAVQVAISHALRMIPPEVQQRTNVGRLHAALAGTVAILLTGYGRSFTPGYRRLLGNHIAPTHTFDAKGDSLETPCDKIHPGEPECTKALVADLPTMAKRITRFYVQLYLIQAVIGIVARGRGKVDHEALRRLPGNIAGSIAFFLSFAAIERFLTCRVAPRPIKDNLLAYGVLTAFAARVASRFESEQRLIGINKLMIGYIASEFMPGAGIFYLVAIFVAYGTGLAQTEDLIRSTITANFQ